MAWCVRRLLFVCLALAVIGGTAGQFARSTGRLATVAAAGTHHDMSDMSAADHAKTPCHDMAPDCGKQLCCVVDVGIPAPMPPPQPAAHVQAVRYWPAGHAARSFVSTPEPLPPRTT